MKRKRAEFAATARAREELALREMFPELWEPVEVEEVTFPLEEVTFPLEEVTFPLEEVTFPLEAQAGRTYAKQMKASEETVNYAAEIKLRAERRLGQVLAETPKAKGTRGLGRPCLGGIPTIPPNSDAPTLSELGISKQQSSDSQRLAAVPEREFGERMERDR